MAASHLTHASRQDPAFQHLRHLPWAVVPYPHYERVEAPVHEEAAGPISRLAFIGGFVARKRALPVIEMVLRETELDVVVTGSPERASDLSRFRGLAPGRLEVLHGYLDAEQLYGVFDGRTAAVISDAEALNSGVVLLALSRGAPVLAPPTPTNRELVEAFGTDWVRLPPAHLDASSVRQLTQTHIPQRLPDMERRTPEAIGRQIAAFLEELGPRRSQ